MTITVVSGSETAPQDTHIAALDTTALQNTLASLQSGEISLTSHGLGQLKGSINVGDGEAIVTSIPYDSGWHLRIDGEKVPASAVGTFADTFLMISAAPGEHTLEMYYISPGFLPGVLLFGITLLLLVIFRIFRNPKEKTK